MHRLALTYLITAVIFFAADFVWLSLMQEPLYQAQLGNLLLMEPKLPVAFVFYAIYIVGLLTFAVVPALRQAQWRRATWGGALLGLVAYATYDLSNLATLKEWSGVVSVIDIMWGTVASGLAATLSFFAVHRVTQATHATNSV